MFDKIEENTRVGSTGRITYPEDGEPVHEPGADALHQHLASSPSCRSASLVFIGSRILGATALKDFGLALFVGLATRAYSSIFVAAPILAWLKEREPRYRAVRLRALQQSARQGREPTDDTLAARAPEPFEHVTHVHPDGRADRTGRRRRPSHPAPTRTGAGAPADRRGPTRPGRDGPAPTPPAAAPQTPLTPLHRGAPARPPPGPTVARDMSSLEVRPDRRSVLPRPWRRHQVDAELVPLVAGTRAAIRGPTPC